MSLNRLPDGTNSPWYEVTAVKYDGIKQTDNIQEWWCNGRKVESIEESAENHFYDVFDKHPFKITEVKLIKE